MEKPPDRGQCVVWYAPGGHHRSRFCVFESEEDAAGDAWGDRDAGFFAVEGVQFPDGTLVKVDEWPMLAWVTEDYAREQAVFDALRAAEPPPVPTGHVRDPFWGDDVPVYAMTVLPPWAPRR